MKGWDVQPYMDQQMKYIFYSWFWRCVGTLWTKAFDCFQWNIMNRRIFALVEKCTTRTGADRWWSPTFTCKLLPLPEKYSAKKNSEKFLFPCSRESGYTIKSCRKLKVYQTEGTTCRKYIVRKNIQEHYFLDYIIIYYTEGSCRLSVSVFASVSSLQWSIISN